MEIHLKSLFALLLMITLVTTFVNAEPLGSLGTGQGFVLFGVIFSIVVCALFFLVISIILTNPPIKIFFLVLGIVCLIFNIGISIVIIQDYFSNFANLNSIFNNFYYLIITLFTIFLILGVVGMIFYAIYSYRHKRGLID